MKVKENNEVRNKVVKALSGKRFSSKTYSVTGLLACPRRTYFIMSGAHEITSESQVFVFAKGRALHNEIEGTFKFRELHREVDNIRGDIDAVGDRVVEIYTTNISSGKVKGVDDVQKLFGRKVRQLMAYCYMTEEKVGDLVILFMSGDYKRITEANGKNVYVGIRPELKCWTLEFTNDELKENWKKLLDNKAEIELALKTGIPPLIVGEEWECNSCGFNHICLGDELVAPRDINEVVAKVMESDIK
jgi:CRISPR/Cas system-associated exonuclease Cas4 (RecB family)